MKKIPVPTFESFISIISCSESSFMLFWHIKLKKTLMLFSVNLVDRPVAFVKSKIWHIRTGPRLYHSFLIIDQVSYPSISKKVSNF